MITNICEADVKAEESTGTTIEAVQSGVWFQPAVWPNGQRPTTNDTVIIPAGISVQMAGIIRAKNITIYGQMKPMAPLGGGFWFDLQTEWIFVDGANALFEVGTESLPYTDDEGAVITLLGTDDGENIAGLGDKFLGAKNGGTISLYGKEKISWTKIGSPTSAGSNTLTLSEAVDWEVGDGIVLTSNRLDPYEAEEKTITAISSDGLTITLDTPLMYPRMGRLESHTRSTDGKTWQVDTRAEVGLLTKNIKIQGDADSEIDGFGGHIMAMNGSTLTAANVELYRLGQKAKMGRYPWHWHLMESSGNGQYLRNSSIHHSYNRAIVIHGTWGAIVDNNVAYDHIGHGIMLEDGSEIDNIISNNLALITRRPASLEEALTPSDFEPANTKQNAAPSTYWITNPNNIFLNNIAAGTSGTGFWFAFPFSPMGQSADDSRFQHMRPFRGSLGEFDGNTSHSCQSGFDINDGLTADHAIIRGRIWDNDGPINFSNHTFFANQLALYSGGGKLDTNQLFFDDFVFIENEMHLMLAGRLTFTESVFVANSASDLLEGKKSIFYNIYDGAGRIYDCHFVGWDQPNNAFFNPNGAALKRSDHKFSDITFDTDARPLMPWTGGSVLATKKLNNVCTQSYGDFIYDVDGSLTGYPEYTLVPKVPFHRTGNEIDIPEWERFYISPYRYVYVNSSNQVSTLVYRKQADDSSFRGVNFVHCGATTFDHQKHLLVSDTIVEHHVLFNSLPASKSIDYWINSEVKSGEFLTVRFKGFGKLSNVTITNATALNSVQAVQNDSASSYYVEPNGDLYFKAVTTNSFNGRLYVISWTGTDDMINFNYDTDGDGLTDIDELRAGSNPIVSDYVSFEFNGTNEGFQSQFLTNPSIGDYVWCLDGVQSPDPQIIKTGLNFSGTLVDTIKVRMKSGRAGNVQLFWQNEDSNSFSANKKIIMPYTRPDEWQVIVFDLTTHPEWFGKTITALRFDHISDGVQVLNHCIDYLRGPSGGYNLDSDGDLVFDIEEEAECRDANDSDDLSFEFTNSTNGFLTNQIDATSTQSDEYWVLRTDYRNAPFITRYGFHINGNELDKIYVRTKSEVIGTYIFIWRNGNNNFGSVSATYDTPHEWAVLEFDVAGHPQWENQTITQLRLDFPPDTTRQTHHWIDYIHAEDGDGTLKDVQLKVFMEGPLDVNANEMSTKLVNDRRLLPGQTPASQIVVPTPAGHPYATAPWNYEGSEGADFTDTSYDTDVVDWVLISLRKDIHKADEVVKAAALLKQDGTIQFVENGLPKSTTKCPLYLVVEHRNHIAAMSPAPIEMAGGVIIHDFTVEDSYRDPTSVGQIEVAPGVWAMYAGDMWQITDVSYDITGADKSVWNDDNGVFDHYAPSDLNLDGDTNGMDKAFWERNNGLSSRVPK